MEIAYKDIEQLLKACKTGDRSAQVYVYKQYYKAMFNTALRIVNDRQEAEDVMQEAFLSAFTQLDSYYQQSTFGAWLKKIVINRSISHLRKKRRLLKLEDFQMDIRSDSHDEIETISYKVKEVKNAIASLNESYRIPLTLKLIEGYDYDEISEMLGITNQNCRTIISRAKAKVRKIIIEEMESRPR